MYHYLTNINKYCITRLLLIMNNGTLIKELYQIVTKNLFLEYSFFVLFV